MRWVEKISWDGSQYRVITVTEAGKRENLPVSALHDIQCGSVGTRRIRVVSDFQTWRRVSPEIYLAGMGFSKKTPAGQDVYEFEASGKEFQVPASVLMQGIFKPLRGLAPHLFRPQGLENLAVALLDANNDQLGFFCSPRMDIGITPERSEGTLAALTWMYCFPSPGRMCDGVIQNARRGKLALSLPKAKATLVLQALRHADKWLVISLNAISLDTSEEPHIFAAGRGRRIELHHAARLDRNGPPSTLAQLDGLLSRDGKWHLSDEEWSAAKSIASKGQPRRHSLREIVDCILNKLGRGTPWKTIQYGNVNQQIVVRSYQEMRKDGRWDSLVQIIQGMRST
jgi:hypothetical protein